MSKIAAKEIIRLKSSALEEAFPELLRNLVHLSERGYEKIAKAATLLAAIKAANKKHPCDMTPNFVDLFDEWVMSAIECFEEISNELYESSFESWREEMNSLLDARNGILEEYQKYGERGDDGYHNDSFEEWLESHGLLEEYKEKDAAVAAVCEKEPERMTFPQLDELYGLY